MDSTGHELYYIPHGYRMYLDVDESPMMRDRSHGLYESEKVEAFRCFLSPGDSVVDAGVNKGYFSLLAARLVGPAGTVFAFEPHPENCKWFLKSVAANGYRHVNLVRAALGATNGVTELYLGEKSGWHSLKQNSENQPSLNVNILQLDDALARMGNPRIKLIKIDVEGAELEVLRGALSTLANTSPLVLLVDLHHSRGLRHSEIHSLLTQQGFSLVEISAPFDRPIHDLQGVKEFAAIKA